MSKRLVIVVEDEPFLRTLISMSLEKAGFEVKGVGSVPEARRLFNKFDPDAVILDIDLGPGPTGLDIGEALQAKSPGTAVVYLTMLSDPRVINPESGTVHPRAAYLNKRLLENPSSLVEALEAVLHDQDISQFRHDLKSKSPLRSLSASQLHVLQLIAAGKTNQQIAMIRNRSLSATEALITRTFSALGIDSARSANGRIIAVKEYIRQAGVVLRDED